MTDMRLKLLLILMITVLLLTACGKKGPVKPKSVTPQSIQMQSSSEFLKAV